MDRKLAEQIVSLVSAHIDQLISSLAPVEAEIPPDEFAAYKRGIARIINSYDAGIIDLVAREYPDSNPVTMIPSRHHRTPGRTRNAKLTHRPAPRRPPAGPVLH